MKQNTAKLDITGCITPEEMDHLFAIAKNRKTTPRKLILQAISNIVGCNAPRAGYRPCELARARGLSRRTIDREIKLWEYGDASHPKHTAGLGPVRRLRRAVIIPAESVAAWDARNNF